MCPVVCNKHSPILCTNVYCIWFPYGGLWGGLLCMVPVNTCGCWDKLNKAEKTQTELFIFGDFLVWHLVCCEHGHRKHTLRRRRWGESKMNSGAPPSSYRRQSCEAERERGGMDTAVYHHLPACIPLIYWFFSSFFFSHHRYHNMGNLLKVLTCTDLEQEPNFFLDFESEFPFFQVIVSSPHIDHMTILP